MLIIAPNDIRQDADKTDENKDDPAFDKNREII